MNVRDAVITTARELGYGHHYTEINQIVDLFERGLSDSEIARTIVRFGASPFTAEQAVSRVRGLLSQDEGTVEATEAFDRAGAAQVIRSFIQQGVDRYVGHDALYEEGDVTALLILAGLEDEPEPVVEEPADVEPGVLRRLLGWARGQGFSG